MDKKKLKTLILVLRSLPIEVQESILHKLPVEMVQAMSTVDVVGEELNNEDLESFYRSWPELAGLLDSVNKEAQKEDAQRQAMEALNKERPKVKDYILFKMNQGKKNPEISPAIAGLIDQVALR